MTPNRIILLVAITSFLSLGSLSCVNRAALAEQELAQILRSVEPWPDEAADYSVASWRALITAARALQGKSALSVEKALRKYQEDYASRPAVKEDTKLLLLMRVIFELPEKLPYKTRDQVQFGGWLSMGTDINSDGSINVAWPISWDHRGPSLIAGFSGLQGRRYDAAEEYRYFRSKYPMRNLDSYPK